MTAAKKRRIKREKAREYYRRTRAKLDTISPEEFRQYARRGALETAKRIVAEFPDVMLELNKIARGQ